MKIILPFILVSSFIGCSQTAIQTCKEWEVAGVVSEDQEGCVACVEQVGDENPQAVRDCLFSREVENIRFWSGAKVR
jgi:hypothetical protein